MMNKKIFSVGMIIILMTHLISPILYAEFNEVENQMIAEIEKRANIKYEDLIRYGDTLSAFITIPD